MSDRPWLSTLRAWLRMFSIGVLAAAPLACAQVAASKAQVVVASANAMCPVGSEGCPCTSGGGCDPGLYCDGGTCVSNSYGGDEDYREYEFADDIAPAPEPVMRTESISTGGRWANKKKSPMRSRSRGRMGKSADASAEGPYAPSPAPAEAELVDASRPEPSGTTSDPADELDHGRQVIYTATLHVAVYERDAAIDVAESLPRRYGGWIESRYDYQITLRIRAEHLFDAIEVLSELGVVLDRTLLAEDVTAEYVDLDSRIRVLEEMVARLEELLAKATSVEQALKIRAALDLLRLELEAARVRMRQLSELIDFSTLTLTLTPRGPEDDLPSSNDPFPWVDDLGVEGTAYR